MKRLFAYVLILILFVSFLSAETITVEGRGNTIEGAKESAREALAERIFPGTMVSSTKLSTQENNVSGYSESFEQNSTYSIVGSFPYLDYEMKGKEKNEWVVSLSISGDEKTINFYKECEDEQKKSAEEFYSRYKSLLSNGTVTQKREALGKVIEYYYYYNLYRNIILRLGGKDESSIDIDTAYPVLLVDYQSLLDEENNELSSIENITAQIKAEFEKNRKATEEYNKAKEEAVLQAELQRKLELDNKIHEIIENRGAYTTLENNDTLDEDNFFDYISVIKDADSSLREAAKEYDKLLSEQTAAIEKSYKEEAAAIRGRTYRIVEQTRDGQPTETAKKIREAEVAKLRESKDKEKSEAIELINSKLSAEIQKRYDYLIECILSFDKKEFSFSSLDGSITISDISNYDGDNFCWWLTIAGTNFPYEIQDVKLYYSDITGEKIPSSAEKRKDFIMNSEYEKNVSQYNSLLKENGTQIALSFKASVSLEGIVRISFKNILINFADGKSAEIDLSDKQSVTWDLSFGKTTYLSYSWLKANEKYEKEQASLIKAEEKKAQKVPFAFKGLDFGGQFRLSLGTFDKDLLWMVKSNPLISMDFLCYTRFFFSNNLFFSFDLFCTLFPSLMNLSSSSATGTSSSASLNWGLMAGGGYRFNDSILVGCRVSFTKSKSIGILLDSYLSYTYKIWTDKSNKKGFFVDLTSGLIYDSSLKRFAFSSGVSFYIPLAFN